MPGNAKYCTKKGMRATTSIILEGVAAISRVGKK